MIKCLHALCDGQRSEAYSKPLQPRQSITLASLISCHWPHCISWCSGGTGSIPWLTFWSQPVVLQIESFQSIKTSKLFWKDFFYLVILRKWRVLIINKAIQEESQKIQTVNFTKIWKWTHRVKSLSRLLSQWARLGSQTQNIQTQELLKAWLLLISRNIQLMQQ